MDYVEIGVDEVWLCGCFDWYDGPRKVDVSASEPTVVQCHRWSCGWMPRTLALDIEIVTALAEWEACQSSGESTGWGKGVVHVVAVLGCCPDCGGTLIDYDDYSVCEFADVEEVGLVGLVSCGFVEEERSYDHPGTDGFDGHDEWECPGYPHCKMMEVAL